MQTQTWTYIDRDEWPRGEWDGEPDKVQWLDEATGLPCLIVRNRSGALCGYAGVAEGHPAFQCNYDDVNVDAHGGLTFSDFCQPYGENKERGVCHVVEEGENERVWWLGFDCAHYGDVLPAHRLTHDEEGYYKPISYVRREVTELARQLAELAHKP